MKDRLEYEKEKYNIVHKSCGFSKNQPGYGRQLKELLSFDGPIHIAWRDCLDQKNSFLEIGIGAGEILEFLDSQNINYCGIDISNYIVDNLPEYNTACMSCHKLDFPNGSFDVVQHLDGMEHIPREWEIDALSEAVRVSNKYILYANAMGDAFLDSLVKSEGYEDGVHINIKNHEQWLEFYENNKNLGYNIKYSQVIHGTFFILLEKI
jgi:hypothetical protein